jgi:hypothetical protein
LQLDFFHILVKTNVMKTISLFTLSCLCFITLSSRAFAQDTNAMKKWMDYMTPGDMQKMLAGYDGNWSEDITLWMDPKQPPTKSTGTAENKMILGGRYQQENITGSFAGTPYEAECIMGYDNMKKVFSVPT